jgi:DNA repair exonuclease SbcCD ATPase subunit
MELPDIGRYRRRFIVEFGPEDSGLVDRMGAAHRTKRAAIIAGLRLLESGEVDQLRTQVADLQDELAKAKEALSGAQQKTRAGVPALTKAKDDLEAEREAHQRTKKALETTRAALKGAQKESAALSSDRDRLAVLIPDQAYCPTCERLVPEAEWAEQPTPDGVDVYHKEHRYRGKGGLVSAANVMARRSKGQA